MVRVLVGRDAECAVLSRALTAAQGGGAPVVLVSGEGGAGKTTLVEHVLARTGVPVLSGRAAEWAGAAYDVLARALRPAVRDMAAPVSPVLAQIFPERAVPPATPDPAALAAGVCSLLGSLAGGRPLALFLDDLQWADQATLLAGGAVPALIAVHLLAARDFEAARAALIAAADAHCAVHAYRDAARALRTALEHWPADHEDDARLAVVGQLARCAEMCSEYAEAVTLLRELADGHERRGEASALAGAQRRLALVHELRGQWEAALTAREAAAVAFSAAGLRAEAATDRLAVATHLRAAGSYSAALGTLGTARADAEHAGRTDLLLRAEGLRGNLLARLGQSREGIAAVRAALDQALAASLPAAAADLLCRACATVVLFARGEWDRAAAVCEDVLASPAVPHARGAAAGMLGLVHAMRGATRQARPHLLESHLIATRIELVPMELFSSWGLCVLESCAGSGADAADRARRMLARLAQTQERHFSVQILQWMASFFAEQSMAADVRSCAAALAGMAETTGQPEAIAALAHARGETLLTDEPAAALRELRRAAEKFGELGLPYATAQAQRRAAEAATRTGDKTAAAELLHAAHDTAGRLGARVLRTACAAALGDLGDKPRPPAAGRSARGARTAGGLTGRELEIMLLVALGNTSRQIGEALFISPRTVEMHVQGSLLKLGCRTRAQAVRRLAELGTLPPGEITP